MQSTTVAYRVYCMIFCRPPSSRDNRLSDGITAVSSCSMIEALMYGMMPSEKTAQFSSAPPLKKIEERRDAAARAFVMKCGTNPARRPD